MPSQVELFGQMAIILDRLVENAIKLKEELKAKASQKELEALQERQHEILSELGQLNALLESSPPGGSESDLEGAKATIRHKLGLFQALNKEFFDSISKQTRIINP